MSMKNNFFLHIGFNIIILIVIIIFLLVVVNYSVSIKLIYIIQFRDFEIIIYLFIVIKYNVGQ